MTAPRVAVVGGGLAGMSAALACADRGARVTLLERGPRLGGATWSFRHGGLWFDNGQHVFLRCCTAYRSFLGRLGVEHLAPLQPRLEVTVVSPDGRRGRLTRNRLPAPLHLAATLARYPFVPARRRLAVARTARALGRLDPDDAVLDERTFGEWLTERSEPPEAVEALWNLIVLPTLNVDVEEASLDLAAMVFRTGLLTEAAAADLGWSRVPLAELHAEPAARALAAAGATIRLRTAAREVRAGPAGVEGIELDDGYLAADAVIVAVPHDRVAGLLPAGTLPGGERLLGLGTSPIVNLHVVYDRQVTALPLAAAVGSPVQWVFDRTESSGLDRGQCLAISLSGADEWIGLRPERLREVFLPELARLFPGARAARVERFLVTREHAATFRPRPGTRALRPGPATGVPGLFVGGAWTDTGWPATMEGAVRSGTEAARLALRHARARAACERASAGSRSEQEVSA